MTEIDHLHAQRLRTRKRLWPLYFMHDNFPRLYGMLRMIPAMAAEVAYRMWSVEGIVALID